MQSTRAGFSALVCFVLAGLVACGDNGGGNTPKSITITPSDPMVAIGETADVSASFVLADGTYTPATDATFTVDNASIAAVRTGVDGHATIQGIAAGTTMLTAEAEGLTSTVTVTVTPAVLRSIAIAPAMPSLAAGTSVRLTATGMYSDATMADLSATVTWSSSATAVATVNATGLLTGLTVGGTTITAAYGAISGTTNATVTAATLTAINVTPTNPSLALGTTQQLTATGVFSDATTQDLTTQVTWASTAPGHVTVSAAGLVTAVGLGTANITATKGTISGTTTVTVTAAALVSIQVTPTNPSVAAGRTQQFTATGTFTDATTQNLTTQVTWASSSAAVATISNAAGSQGLAKALTPGATTISAALGAVVGSTSLTVTAAVLVSIQVTPTNPSVAAGRTQQFTATGTFSDATTQNLTTQVAWTSSAAAVATISNAAGSQGLATALKVGTTTISATLGGVTGSTTLTVSAAVLVSIQVTPTNPSVAAGRTQQFTATGTFSDATTQNLTTQVTWASSATAIATISNAAGSQGLATALKVGTTTISATLGGVTGSTTLTVTAAVLVSIQVTPTNPSVAAGRTQQFTATGTFSDATTQNLTTQVTWASSATATATISNAAGSQGLATALKLGTTTISATLAGVTGSTTLTVTAAVLVSIQVTPVNPSVAAGRTQQFTATGTFSDATTQNLTTQVTWASSATAIATISNAAGSQGLATALKVGTTTISATLAGVTGSTTLTVTAAVLVSIQVTPANVSLALGLTQQYTATGVFSDATTQNLTTQVTWASANEAIMKISIAAGSQGDATALGVGSTTISATLGAIAGSTAVTVTAAVLVSIAVTPAATTVSAGQKQQFTATGTFTDLTTQDLTRQVTWASSSTAVAQISNAGPTQGLATAIATGTTTISATFTGVTGSTTLTVR
jgi:uncharacterized protein YjdB